MNGYVVTITSVEKRTKEFNIKAESEEQARQIATEIIDIHGTKDWKVDNIRSFFLKARKA